MTEYTAEDFARARVAIQGERESARRTYPSDDWPWLSRNGDRWSDHALAKMGWTPVQENVLTDDDITDEMVQRIRDAAHDEGLLVGSSVARRLLTSALTEPTRPEGAEEIEAAIGLNAGKWTNGADVARAVADLLAENGFRVVGEQS